MNYSYTCSRFLSFMLKVIIFCLIAIVLMTAVNTLNIDEKSFGNIMKEAVVPTVLCIVGLLFLFPLFVGAIIYNPIVSLFGNWVGFSYDMNLPTGVYKASTVKNFTLFKLIFIIIPFTLFSITSYLLFPYMLSKTFIMAHFEKKEKVVSEALVMLICLAIDVIGVPGYFLGLYMLCT